MKKILKITAMFLLIITTLGCGKNASLKEGDNALVTFKDTSLNITTNDLYETLKDKYGINFLIDMIDEKILNKEYETDDEAKNYVEIQVNALKNYYETEAEFLEYINNYGYQDEEALKEYFLLNYKRNLAIYDYLEDLLSDDEINNYYENKIDGDITGSHILIEANITTSMTEDEKRTAKEEALKKANEALEKLNNGTSFAEVAKEYSTDDATNQNGGSMGTFNSLDLDDVTRQAFQKLEVGSYSTEALETEYGYEILLKEAEKEKASLEEVKDKIIKILSDEKLNEESKLQYKALESIRLEYGFKINDEDLDVYYENTMNNLLKSE